MPALCLAFPTCFLLIPVQRRISRAKEEEDKRIREEYFHAAREALPRGAPLKEGRVQQLKQASKADMLKSQAMMWKSRVLWLGAESLFILDKAGAVPDASTSTSVTLEDARVTLPISGVATSSRRQYCFVLQVRSWTKHGKFIAEGRDFVFALATEGEREEWMYLLQFAVEGHRHGAKGASTGRGASGAAPSPPKPGFSRRPSEASMSFIGAPIGTRKTSDDLADSAPKAVTKRRSEV